MKYLFFTSFLALSINSFANECKTVDLSAEGGVLHPVRATNQNGLGICHIEQLQHLLKAKMKNSPDLARISLAILEKSERDKNASVKKAVRWKKSDGLPGGTFIDAGNACLAYDLVKGKEICESKYDLFESLTKANAFDQQKVLNALSLYFDGKSTKVKGKYLSTEIMNVIEAEYLKAADVCKINEKEVESFISHYQAVGGKGNPHHLKNLQIKTYLNTSNMGEYALMILHDLNELQLKDFRFKLSYNSLIEALKKQEKCASSKLSLSSENLCKVGHDEDLKRILDLSAIGFTGKDLYRFTNFTQDRDEYFKRALYCEGKKLKIPDALNCSNVDLLKMAKEETYVQDFSQLLDKNLESGTPLGISICTRFFKDPKVKTIQNSNYTCGDKDNADYRPGEGSHAVTIIGKRCNGGKKEFLVQNSWGTGCGYYHKDYECNNKGGVWVGEEVLAKNSRSLNILK